MSINIENVTYAYVAAFVDELARSGVQNVVVCPGSRSTPLAYSFEANEMVKVWMEYDERSAGFFALGMAKVSNSPVALVCTSGTAAANFTPAVVEAHYANVPLIVLTADRPAELRDNGAPQAIDQNRMFGVYAKWYADMAIPEATNQMLRYVRTIACRAVGMSISSPAGPVHLNMPFREPFLPHSPTDYELPSLVNREPSVWEGRADNQPYVRLQQAPRHMQPDQIEIMATELVGVERGLIICGPQENPALAYSLTKLAVALDYPILADPLSQLRCGSHDRRSIITNYDAFLRDKRFATQAEYEPEVVIRFGAMPRSKPLLQYLNGQSNYRYIVVDGNDQWNDPTSLAAQMIYVEPTHFCRDLALSIWARLHWKATERTRWLEDWLKVSEITQTSLTKQLQNLDEVFEGRILAEMSQLLTDGALLYVGNSMPVRDLDSFFAGSEHNIRVTANYGANGIDGVVSSALGAATANNGPTILVIGDLSFYHDLNGLLAAKLHGIDATIVVINNDGGGIFSFLPQADYPDNFEQLFGTPHGLDFEHIAKMYNAQFYRSNDWSSFRRNVTKALNRGGLKIIEVQTERKRNVTLHRQIWEKLFSSINEA